MNSILSTCSGVRAGILQDMKEFWMVINFRHFLIAFSRYISSDFLFPQQPWQRSLNQFKNVFYIYKKPYKNKYNWKKNILKRTKKRKYKHENLKLKSMTVNTTRTCAHNRFFLFFKTFFLKSLKNCILFDYFLLLLIYIMININFFISENQYWSINLEDLDSNGMNKCMKLKLTDDFVVIRRFF